VFLSELTIIRAGFADAAPALAIALLVLLAVVFIALVGAVAQMTFGTGPPRVRDRPYPDRASRLAAATPLVAGLIGLLLLGVWIPAGLNSLIMHSIRVIS